MLGTEARTWRVPLIAVALLIAVAVVVDVTSSWLSARTPARAQPPLTIGYTEVSWLGDRAEIAPPLTNNTDVTIELLSARVPGAPDAKVQRSADFWQVERGRLLPVAGLRIKPHASEWLEIDVPARCPLPRIETLEVLVRAEGREVTRVLQMPRIAGPGCPAQSLSSARRP